MGGPGERGQRLEATLEKLAVTQPHLEVEVRVRDGDAFVAYAIRAHPAQPPRVNGSPALAPAFTLGRPRTKEMTTSLVADFFQRRDPERALAALRGVAGGSRGPVRSTTLWSRARGELDLRGAPGGLFAPTIFGDDREAFGHVDTGGGLLHPAVLPTLAQELELSFPQIEAVLRGDLALRQSDSPFPSVVTASSEEPGDRVGPLALARALHHKAPDHPYLPLCRVPAVPVPPLSARPLRPGDRPELVDPWIGPENEAWLPMLHRAARYLKLHELGANDEILAGEATCLQRAFDAVFKATMASYAWLIPPLARSIDTALKAVAFTADPNLPDAGAILLIQRGDGIFLVDSDGRTRRSFAPAGCKLRAIVEGRYAVFHGVVEGVNDPLLRDKDGAWPSWFVGDSDLSYGVDPVMPISVLDLERGEYLTRRPAWLPRAFPEHREPEEELWFADHQVFMDTEGPDLMSFDHGLRFVCIGDESERRILDLATTRAAAFVADGYGAEHGAEHELDLVAGALGEPDPDGDDDGDDDDDDGGDAEGTDDLGAIGFADGAWFLVGPDGVLSDHLGRERVQLVPAPLASAFSPSASHLAVAYRRPDKSVEVAILERRTRAVVARLEVARLGSEQP